MLQALLLFIIGPLVIITGLLFAVGVLEYEKPDYVCWPPSSKGWQFDEKVEIFSVGSLTIYSYPLSYTCDEQWQMPADSEVLQGVPTDYL